MLVLICGMPRSGSTLSFNFAREALARRGSVRSLSAFHLTEVTAEANTDHVINKAHDVDEATVALVRCGAIRAICTVRRPEDAVLSWQKAFGFDLNQSIESFQFWFRLYDRISQYSLMIDFDDIERHPFRVARRIGRYVAPNYSLLEAWTSSREFSKRRVQQMVNGIVRTDPDVVDLGYTFHDRKTMFHRTHITSARAEAPDPGVISQIREGLNPWVDEQGQIRRKKAAAT